MRIRVLADSSDEFAVRKVFGVQVLGRFSADPRNFDFGPAAKMPHYALKLWTN